jgi:hypothetical protein
VHGSRRARKMFHERSASPIPSARKQGLIAIVYRLGNDRTGLSLLRLYGRMRFRRELEHGCLLAFT